MGMLRKVLEVFLLGGFLFLHPMSTLKISFLVLSEEELPLCSGGNEMSLL